MVYCRNGHDHGNMRPHRRGCPNRHSHWLCFQDRTILCLININISYITWYIQKKEDANALPGTDKLIRSSLRSPRTTSPWSMSSSNGFLSFKMCFLATVLPAKYSAQIKGIMALQMTLVIFFSLNDFWRKHDSGNFWLSSNLEATKNFPPLFQMRKDSQQKYNCVPQSELRLYI